MSVHLRSVADQTYTPDTQEAEERGWQSETSLGYMVRSCPVPIFLPALQSQKTKYPCVLTVRIHFLHTLNPQLHWGWN